MEIKEPFFSVIIPTTGGRLENLELVLTSLANQWFPKSLYEVIVVNDGGEWGSDKEVYDLVKGFGKSKIFSSLAYIWSEKFEPLDFDLSPDDIGKVEWTLGSWGSIKHPFPNTDDKDLPNIQPRNKGALFARGDFLIFADSDIILCPTALSCYFQDMIENPNRIMLGIYHWLYPMHITPDDVTTRFYDIINERLAKKLLTEVEPDNQQTHNICRDMRMKDFNEFSPDQVFTKPGHINVALACYSGNIYYVIKD